MVVGGRTHHGDPTQKTGSKKLSMALNGTRSDVGPPFLWPRGAHDRDNGAKTIRNTPLRAAAAADNNCKPPHKN